MSTASKRSSHTVAAIDLRRPLLALRAPTACFDALSISRALRFSAPRSASFGLALATGLSLLAVSQPTRVDAQEHQDVPDTALGSEALPAHSGQERAIPRLSPEDRALIHESLLESRAYRARVQAAIMLGRRGDVDEDLPVLRRALREDSHYTVRGAAALAIGNLGSPRGIEPLLGAAADRHAFVRRAAQNAMDELASSELAIPYLVLAREREAPHVRLAAVNALGRLDAPHAREALAEFLGDRDEGVGTAIERAFASWTEEEAIRVLARALEHPSSFHVRLHAAELSSRHAHPDLLDALVARLLAPLEEPRVQVAARRSIEGSRHLLDVEDLVKRVQGVPNRDVRARAILLLGIHGGDRAVDLLIRTVIDPDIRVRYYAVMALGAAGDPRAAPVLLRMQADPSNARLRGTITASLEDLSRIAEN